MRIESLNPVDGLYSNKYSSLKYFYRKNRILKGSKEDSMSTKNNERKNLTNKKDENSWVSPLPEHYWSVPLGKYHPSGFGARRKYNLHTGVDLFCDHNQPLASVEDGIIIGIRNFSKKKVPWLNQTRVILIEGKTGVVAYCNVKEREGLRVGDEVLAGEIIGNVIRINKKKKKNKKDLCMLHLELYSPGTKKRAKWSYNFPKPPQLLNPTQHLLDIITDSQVIIKRRK